MTPKVNEKLKCVQCGHTWFPRERVTFRCANLKCQSFAWNLPAKEGEK